MSKGYSALRRLGRSLALPSQAEGARVRIPRATLLALLVFLHAQGFAQGIGEVRYTLEPVPPGAQEALTRVRMEIHGARAGETLRLQMPVWSPGDYHVQNHGRYVRELSAETSKGERIPTTRDGEHTWVLKAANAEPLQVRYELPNTPPGFFSENVRVWVDHAFYNGPAVYLYVAGAKERPARVRVVLPPKWERTLCPLDPAGPEHPNEYLAPDYDTLADSPVLAGKFELRQTDVLGKPHLIAFFNRMERVDFDSFPPIVKRIAEAQAKMMGGLPMKRYVFFFDIGGRGGGLEHLDSTRIALFGGARGDLSTGIIAHEYFHLWCVKRIRPAVLGPFDYIDPPRTANLWFCEGVTDYMAGLSLRRAGLVDDARYLGGLAGSIAGYRGTPARLKVTADESSLRVWEGGNSQGSGGLSYYQKGHVIGLCLDLKLRALTAGRSSLESLMRDLLARYGLPKPGFPEDGIREAAIRAGGPEMGPFYDLLCRSTREMPFEGCFAEVGLTLRRRGTQGYEIVPDPVATPVQARLRRGWLQGE